MVAGVMIFIYGMWGFVLVALAYSTVSRMIRKGKRKPIRGKELRDEDSFRGLNNFVPEDEEPI